MSNPDDVRPKPISYEESGVSIDRGDQAVQWIKPLAEATRRPEVVGGIGGFAGEFRLQGTELLAGADGVGSKLLLAKALGRYDTIGLDLVAMNANDVLAAGGEPLFFLDYIAMGRVNPERVREIVVGVSKGCQEAGCALLGGETAEMPDLYRDDDFDLSGFLVGRRVYRPSRLPEPGDILMGLASSGFHSNGYQLIRTVISRAGRSLGDPLQGCEKQSLGMALLKPTTIYVKAVRALWTEVEVLAMAHITGGGIVENVPRSLRGAGVEIDRIGWRMPGLMREVQTWGAIEDQEMFRTFNCGIGFTVVVPPSFTASTEKILARYNIQARPLGRVVATPGVTFR